MVFKIDFFNCLDIYFYFNKIISLKELIINLILICYVNGNLKKKIKKDKKKF